MKNLKFYLSVDDSNICVKQNEKIIVPDNTRAFTSFIGKSPPELVISETAKVWEVVRCGAVYHHNGIKEVVTKLNSAKLFCDFYDLEIKKDGNYECCNLYKYVNDDLTDYFSGKLKYVPGTDVYAYDWLDNERIVCGNALHLVAQKKQAEQWNEGGRLLKCTVRLNDMCVFPYNISQVRCKMVYVQHNPQCHYLHFCDQECDCHGNNN